MTNLPTVTILGSRVHAITIEQSVEAIEGWIRTTRCVGSYASSTSGSDPGSTGGGAGRYVVATGMHGVLEGYRDRNFLNVLNGASLFVPDGYSLVWLARRYGCDVPRRVCGTDLLHAVCRRAASQGFRMFFYGDTPEVLGRLIQRLQALYPGLVVAGSYSPPFRSLSAIEDDAIVDRINAARPDVVWVGLGLPKQEQWIVDHQHRLEVPVCVAVGAAFKFAGGSVRRAPTWMGEHGLEWVWRFVHEPARLWRRVLMDIPLFTGLVLMELARVNIHRAMLGAAAKRAFDLCLAAAGLLVSWPLWFVIAAFIKLEDGGPVFYTQERVGRRGRRFRSYKFRTMVPDADARFGSRQALEHDPRVTRIGRLLRASAMDELPQLLNIFKGDMSFVGPRALAVGEIEVRGHGAYEPLEAIPGYAPRHAVRPGLTGVAQIYAPRDVPRRKKFRYDVWYIRRSSLWMDLRLIAVSFWITFRGAWERRSSKLR